MIRITGKKEKEREINQPTTLGLILIVIIEMDDFQRLSIFQKFEKSSIYDDLRVFYKIMEKSRHLESIYGSVLGLLAV